MTRRTIARPAELEGIGLHSGARVRLRLEPAEPGTGIRFVRSDVGGREIPATLEAVAHTERRTALRSGADRVDTVEHLLAAVYAAEIDDLALVLDGPEVPILEGSFAPFSAALADAGVTERDGRVRHARVTEGFEVHEGAASYRVDPGEGFRVGVTLVYDAPVIGRQRADVAIDPEAFAREVAPARTFGFLAEVEPLKARGLLAGATEECAVVLAPDRVLNTTLRWPDEFARHKVGDLVGDLALLGARLHLTVSAERPSHRGNLTCARAIARAARFTEA